MVLFLSIALTVAKSKSGSMRNPRTGSHTTSHTGGYPTSGTGKGKWYYSDVCGLTTSAPTSTTEKEGEPLNPMDVL